MAFVSDRKMGTGPLYSVGAADPYAYFTADAIYYQTSAGLAAVQIGVSGATLVVAGSIGSVGRGVEIADGASADITVTETGAIRAREDAISIALNAGPVRLTNDGRIESGSAAITVAGGSAITLLNTGVIATTGYNAIALGSGDDRIVNTGTITGDIELGSGNDTLDTRAGTVTGTIYGNTGSDLYYIRGSEDIYESPGADGIDTVYSLGDYTLRYGLENLYLIGDARRGVGNALDNIISTQAFGATLLGAGGDDALIANGGDAVLRGGADRDVLFGSAGDDVLAGGTGDDQLYDFAGTNTIIGGAGDDYVNAGVDDDAIDGGAGSDTVVYRAATAGVAISLAAGTATGEGVGTDTLKNVENVQGSFFADTLTGNAAANTLVGETGDDQLRGASGDDVLNGGEGADRLDGGTGADTASYQDEVFGGARVNLATGVTGGSAIGDVLISIENLIGTDAVDVFVGSDGANRLDGLESNDQLSGGLGADALVGGAGNDQLTGGGDADIFLFADARSDLPLGNDLIQDFQDNVDKISFVGNSAVDAFSDLTFSQSGTTARIEFADGGIIRILNTNVAQLTAADFLFG